MKWKLADAKNRFSELVNLALIKGPQRVLRRSDTVIVLALKDYEKLTGKHPTFKEYLMQGPNLNGLDFKRDSSPMREVNL